MSHVALSIVAEFKAKQGMQESMRRSLERAIEPTQSEPANRGYALHQGIEDPTFFVIYEGWTSEDGFAQHLQTPHFKQMAQDLKETLERPYAVYKLRHIGGAVAATV